MVHIYKISEQLLNVDKLNNNEVPIRHTTLSRNVNNIYVTIINRSYAADNRTITVVI